MVWIERRGDWLPVRSKGKRPEKQKMVEQVYSVSDAANLMGVSRATIFKWMALDAPDEAVIPPNGWYRLPSGHIRIREWVLVQIQGTG